MTNRFMMSVAAAALIAGTGFANAQGTGTSRDAPSSGSTVQQSAPSEPTKPGMKATQSDEKAQPGAKSKSAQDDMKAPKGEKSAQDNNMKGEKSKSMSSETDKSGKDMKAEQKGATDSKSTQTGQSTQSPSGQSGQTTQSQTGQSQTTTTGQAGAGAKLSTEQRTQISSVIRGQRVQPATNVNFSISVGTRVPRNVGFHPLPREVVTIYPQWRGYEFFLVNNQIIVVNPRTLEIVDVIDA
jgi:hypothetical protein